MNETWLVVLLAVVVVIQLCTLMTVLAVNKLISEWLARTDAYLRLTLERVDIYEGEGR